MKNIIINGVDTGVQLERYPSRLPSQDEVETFEKNLGYKLPSDYREFLLSYNGGACKSSNVVPRVNKHLSDLYCFDVSDQPRCNPLLLPEDWQEEWGGLTDNVLPIGETERGDLIALQFAGNKSEVIVLDHVTIEENTAKIESFIPNFTEFLATTIRDDC